jgi:hypothetical protein
MEPEQASLLGAAVASPPAVVLPGCWRQSADSRWPVERLDAGRADLRDGGETCQTSGPPSTGDSSRQCLPSRSTRGLRTSSATSRLAGHSRKSSSRCRSAPNRDEATRQLISVQKRTDDEQRLDGGGDRYRRSRSLRAPGGLALACGRGVAVAERELNTKRRAVAVRALEGDPSSDRLSAILEAEESRATAGIRPADSIVAYNDDQRSRPGLGAAQERRPSPRLHARGSRARWPRPC